MILVDVHAHLNHNRFALDLPDVVQRAKTAGVHAIICNGVNNATNTEVLELSHKYPVIKPAVGLYPLEAAGVKVDTGEEQGLKQDSSPDVNAVINFARMHKKEIAAIGEVGLDYKWTQDTVALKKMRDAFSQMIDIAEELHKPIIVHSRSAEADVIEMLQSSSSKKVVLHCFGGRKNLLRRGAALGFSFSIPPVCVRLKHFEMVIEEVPISQLLTETDAPYLVPQPGIRNEPAFVLESVKKIAEIKRFTVDDTANSIWLNYQKLFDTTN